MKILELRQGREGEIERQIMTDRGLECKFTKFTSTKQKMHTPETKHRTRQDKTRQDKRHSLKLCHVH
ncbi:hypothetical protein T05_12972 [Trichinella murrelli]|uniref:Uncharacterized protein n=1 Tax=Trichinella murrelli TaxID=144512 RepID=A0A0V0TJP4_9BILA|nr:hypothetical protein T05_12972 [Trichinella murrelli]